MNEVRDVLSRAVQAAYDESVDIELTRTDPQFGDFACNVALQLAKKVGQNPREVAEKILDSLPTNDLIDSVAVAGPGFINVRLTNASLVRALSDHVTNDPRGFASNDIGKGSTIICEFPSPNMAKPFSVGHIRSALQGWALYKLMERCGYKVIRDNHIGDYGTPFGKWVVGFLRYSSKDKLQQDGVYELARVYIAITADMKHEKQQGVTKTADEVQDWLVKLEHGDKEAKAYSKQFNQISLDHMHHVMDRLRIETDEELGESHYVKRGQELVDELLKKGIAKHSEGAVIVPLDDVGIDTPIMLRKANGAALYATTDLATIEYRQKHWNPSKVFIHTGQEQVFYFEQLKALAKKAGYKDTIVHLWHGIVDQLNDEGEREKMSSRKGVVLLEELLDTAQAKAVELTKDGTANDADAVALGAIKFLDFKADRKTGILFDWESIFNVHGFSGPAVQYAIVRIQSILQKADLHGAPKPNKEYDWSEEHALLLELAQFPGLIMELHDTYELQKLAHYVYGLAQELNRYYEKVRVLESDEPARQARLWLLTLVSEVMSTSLDILGIPVPEKM
ncbi:arginine--tRNA ligase [Candidatus Saccharibacteria bacterium]|nr:arginine--tRNA ligase [Candidatus Saccharibacteria bacterium]